MQHHLEVYFNILRLGLDLKYVSVYYYFKIVSLYLFCNLYVAMLFLNISILLPVAIAVGITQKKDIKCLPNSCEDVLQQRRKILVLQSSLMHKEPN